MPHRFPEVELNLARALRDSLAREHTKRPGDERLQELGMVADEMVGLLELAARPRPEDGLDAVG